MFTFLGNEEFGQLRGCESICHQDLRAKGASCLGVAKTLRKASGTQRATSTFPLSVEAIRTNWSLPPLPATSVTTPQLHWTLASHPPPGLYNLPGSNPILNLPDHSLVPLEIRLWSTISPVSSTQESLCLPPDTASSYAAFTSQNSYTPKYLSLRVQASHCCFQIIFS